MSRAQLLYTQQVYQAFLVLLVAMPFVVLHCAATQHSTEEGSFEIQNDTFVKNGQPLQMISGRHVTHTPFRVQKPELHDIKLSLL